MIIYFRMNCLLLADEFRARISTALGLIPNPPDEFEWEELSYPIPQNTNFTGVRTIDQLKKVNALMAADMEDGIKEDSEEKKDDETDFDIGVWDPSLGEKYKDVPLNAPGEEKISNSMIVDEDDYMLEEDSEWSQIAIDMFDLSRDKETIKQNLSLEDCPVLGWDDENVGLVQPLDGELAIGSVLGLDQEGLTRDIARINPGEPVSKKRKNERQIFGTDEITEEDMKMDMKRIEEELEKQIKVKLVITDIMDTSVKKAASKIISPVISTFNFGPTFGMFHTALL